jgi:hypothetical protein
MGIAFFLPNVFANTTNFPSDTSDFSEVHIIEGVPYVAQNGTYFCYYACLTMIFDYMELNASLNEMSFYGGVGYTHSYGSDERLPNDIIYFNLNFVFDMYGVTEQEWQVSNPNLPKDELWEQYYARLKENISKDTPVMVAVDPFSMPSLRNQFIINDFLWNLFFPPGFHLIVVIGYNDTNQSICYNDPNAGFYGANRYGDHVWMALGKFREAVEKNKYNVYLISTYKQIYQPYTKKEAFEAAFRKNIENLKGNFSHWILGINASKKMQLDFSPGKNSKETRLLYKKYGKTGLNFILTDFIHKWCSILYPQKPTIFDILSIGTDDPYKEIAFGKNHIANFLENCSIHPDLCKNQSNLLMQEAAKWNELSQNYKIFLRRGILLSDLRAALVMVKMEKLIENIIGIEEALISESSDSST